MIDRKSIPDGTPTHAWKAPTTKGVLYALFERWRKIPASEREVIDKSIMPALVTRMSQNIGLERSKRGGANNHPLFLLSLEAFRNLRQPNFRKLIAEAVESNDCAFFVRLGEALRKKPKPISASMPDNTVYGFLIANWFNLKNRKTPPLACLSPKVLAGVTKAFFPDERM